MNIEYYKNIGDINKQSILVESHVFDIPQRLKEIDREYFVMFNPNNQRYELHHSEQITGTYCLTFPFEELDSRAIEYTLKTRVQNIKKIRAEMEEANKKRELEIRNQAEDIAKWKFKEIYQHAIRHGTDGEIDNGAYKTKFL